MKTRMQTASSQRGFSLLTGFILAIIMFGSLAFFLAGQGINSGFGSTYSNTSKVSALLTSAGYVTTGFDAVTLGGTSPTIVTFDSAVSTGIFNPTSGGAAPQSLDPTLFQGRTGASGLLDGYWIYHGGNVALNAVGTTAGEYTIMTSGLKLSVCQQINTTLHGAATIPVLTQTDAGLLGTPTAASPVATVVAPIDLSLATPLNTNLGWLNGCYQSATSGNYIYIHTLLAQ